MLHHAGCELVGSLPLALGLHIPEALLQRCILGELLEALGVGLHGLLQLASTEQCSPLAAVPLGEVQLGADAGLCIC